MLFPFGHLYPYSDLHDLNLDWMLVIIKKLQETVENFVAYNALKFAGDWDGTKVYEAWTVVDDGSGNGYLSLKPVPAGVPLSNENYWAPMSDYNALYTAFDSRITALETSISGYVPVTRTVNGKQLSVNITVNSDEVPYDNSASGLSGSTVKAALDEVAAGVEYETGSVTSNGITYHLYKFGRIVFMSTSGYCEDAIAANAAIAGFDAKWRPVYSMEVWESSVGHRMTLSTDGNLYTAAAYSAAQPIRFSVCYIAQN